MENILGKCNLPKLTLKEKSPYRQISKKKIEKVIKIYFPPKHQTMMLSQGKCTNTKKQIIWMFFIFLSPNKEQTLLNYFMKCILTPRCDKDSTIKRKLYEPIFIHEYQCKRLHKILANRIHNCVGFIPRKQESFTIRKSINTI